jgi:hypothetical protein
MVARGNRTEIDLCRSPELTVESWNTNEIRLRAIALNSPVAGPKSATSYWLFSRTAKDEKTECLVKFMNPSMGFCSAKHHSSKAITRGALEMSGGGKTDFMVNRFRSSGGSRGGGRSACAGGHKDEINDRFHGTRRH